jgi:hypothetical protein
MKKQVVFYLIVGILAFTVGSFSAFSQEKKTEEKKMNEQAILQKLDKILANQEAIKDELRIIRQRS